MWAALIDFGEDSFLHNFRYVGAHHTWSDVVKPHRSFRLGLLQWNQPSYSQIFWYRGSVESIGDFLQNFVLQLAVIPQHISIKAIRT